MKAAQARVLLTGAGGGIGQAVADTLAGAGAALMLAGRSPARLPCISCAHCAQPDIVRRHEPVLSFFCNILMACIFKIFDMLEAAVFGKLRLCCANTTKYAENI